MKVLVIEDEWGVAAFVSQALTEFGAETHVDSDGRDGLVSLKTGIYDVAVIDLMLPRMDGLEIVRQARISGVRTPILILSARGALSDRVAGLNIGADDFLVKPFKVAELLARVRALGRRLTPTVLTMEDLVVDARNRKASRGGRTLYLSPTEFALLELLMRQAGAPVGRAEILREVWNEAASGNENLIEVYVRHLRQKTELNGGARIIHTVRGKGYMLAKEPPHET